MGRGEVDLQTSFVFGNIRGDYWCMESIRGSGEDDRVDRDKGIYGLDGGWGRVGFFFFLGWDWCVE